jgi:DNA-binding SARP family transcriptional activator
VVHLESRPHIHVGLLDRFSVVVEGREVELPPSGERIVALLALMGRMSRSRIADTLWPDASQRQASSCLRSGVWRVNRVVSGVITATRFTLDLSSGVEVDVHRYLAMAATGVEQQSPTPATDALGPWAHGGDLLPDWDDEWLLADRERLRQVRLHVLEEQAERLVRAQQYGQALDAAFAALMADPARESAHRAIIRIHLAEGNPSEARRAYLACRQVLRRDLGVEPSESTTRMLGAEITW